MLSNGAEIISKKVYTTASASKASAEFFELTNGTEYTFNVTTVAGTVSDPSDEITATPAITKKTSDWVIAMYMDGDNNLNDAIYMDMNEAEYGLYQTRMSDGITTTGGYDPVSIVALWDGVVSFEAQDAEGNKVTKEPKIGTPGSYLFELGTDSSATANRTTDRGCVLSSKTKNLSYTAPWLVGSTKQVSTEQPTSHGEVNMGSKQTLINFLNWVNDHYTANKGIILQFSDHGGGPRNVICAQTEDGKTATIGGFGDRRALCWDDSSGKNEFLKTKDVSDALEATGFGTNKASIILMDLCLGSSVEDAYQFKDYAEYYAASPNTIPGIGLNYVYFMKSFTKNIETEVLAKQILLDYRQQYAIDNDMWDYFAQQYYGDKNATYSKLSNSEKAFIEWVSDFGITTFTITDLSKIDDVKDSINALCDVLISNEGKSKTVYVDANGSFSPTVTSKTENYVSYLGQHHANVVNYGKSG